MRYRRILSLLLAAVLLLGLLAGCGAKSEPEGNTENGQSGSQTATGSAIENGSSGQNPSGQSGENTKTFDWTNAKAENNGGYFVGLGERVYFREYDDLAFEGSALWGEFLPPHDHPNNSGRLLAADAASGEIVFSQPDSGNGPIWYADGLFWMTRRGPAGSDVYTIKPDGTDLKERAGGEVMGVSASGSLVAVQGESSGAHATELHLWKGEEEVAYFPDEGETYEYCGFAGESMIYTSYNEGMLAVWEGGEDNLRVLLGLYYVPETDYDYTPKPEFEQLSSIGDDIRLVFGYYQGTGHFYAGALILGAQLGKPDSLKPVESEENVGSEEMPPILLADEDGFTVVPAKAGSIELSEATFGDLIYYDSPYSAIRTAKDFITVSPYESDGGAILQTAEAVGDYAYVMVAHAVRNAEEDIGWREAFDCARMYYLRVRLAEDSAAETLTGYFWTGIQEPPAGALASLQQVSREDALAADPLDEIRIDNSSEDHEQAARQWFLLTVLEDNVLVRVEAADLMQQISVRYAWQGGFLPGEVLEERYLNEGDCIAVYASLPWNAEARVTVSKAGRFGQYIFGEDNWLYGAGGKLPMRYLKGEILPKAAYTNEDELFDFLDGSWIFIDRYTGLAQKVVSFNKSDRTMHILDEQAFFCLEADHIYTQENEHPDLLKITAEDEDLLPEWVHTDYGTPASIGDYLIDCITTDTEEFVLLHQANNGDAALGELIGYRGEYWYDILLHRWRGGANGAFTEPKDQTIPALLWQYDEEKGLVWFSAAEKADEDEAGYPVLRPADRDTAWYAYLKDESVIRSVAGELKIDYPAAYCLLRFDENGAISEILSPYDE